MSSILDSIKLLHQPGEVIEIRMPKVGFNKKGTYAGYYDNYEKAAEDALRYNGKVPAVYIILNPVKTELLSRYYNRIEEKADGTTSDNDIVKRTWLYVDIDPIRPALISSTDQEHKVAIDKAYFIKEYMLNKGWPQPIICDSGNGSSLLYKIEIENNSQNTELIKKCLEAFSYLFTDDRTEIDLTVFNAARIIKLYGTIAKKGDNTQERPHRESKILEIPTEIKTISIDQLKEFLKVLPEETTEEHTTNKAGFDIESWLSKYGIQYSNKKIWHDGTLYQLEQCPFDSNHKAPDSSIIKHKSGALSFQCFHNSCKDKHWQELRNRYEPDYQDRKETHKEGKKVIKDIKAPLELPPIPHEAIDSRPTNINELLETFKKHLYIEEDYSITIPLAEVIGNFANIEPDILGIIGASGSSKTELIRALGELENQYCYPVSSLTGHTFVSGLKENIDLAPCLRGRLLTIKDFTSILSKKKDEVSEIFADLRELTDGHIGKDFGSGVKKHYKNIHTSVLFGCTNAIEKHNSMYSNLGQRIVFFRPRSDKKKAMQQAVINAGTENAFRDELHKVTLQFINTTLSNNKDRLITLSHIPNDMIKRVEGLVTFLANVRTPIDRDFKGNMATIPEPEYPTRLAKTMCKLIDAHSLLYNRTPTKQDEYVAYRLTLDNIPVERLRVLRVLIDGNEKTTSEVQQIAKIPNSMAHRVLDDLKALEIIEYFSMGNGKPDIWQLKNEEYGEILEILVNLDKLFFVKASPDVELPQGDIRFAVYTDTLKDVLHFLKIRNKSNGERVMDSTLSEYHPTVKQDAEVQQKTYKDEKSEEQKTTITELPKYTDFELQAKDWMFMSGKVINSATKTEAAMWIAARIKTRQVLPSDVMAFLEHRYAITPESA